MVESINSHGFKYHMQVEVVDKMCVSAMRVARVEEIIGGRLRLQYSDTKVCNCVPCNVTYQLSQYLSLSEIDYSRFIFT